MDDDAARHGLVTGYSPTMAPAALLGAAARKWIEVGAVPWFAGVPTASNPADGPSRLDHSAMAEWPGFAQVPGDAVAHVWRVVLGNI